MSSFHRHNLSMEIMENSARQFICACCRRQVIICSDCDRGNIYCSKSCSRSVRKKSQREASRCYQKTRKGKLKNAARQKSYRQRQKVKIVTHHGSQDLPPHDLLPPEPNEGISEVTEEHVENNRCCFCNKICSPFIRTGYLRRSTDKYSRHDSS